MFMIIDSEVYVFQVFQNVCLLYNLFSAPRKTILRAQISYILVQDTHIHLKLYCLVSLSSCVRQFSTLKTCGFGKVAALQGPVVQNRG